MTISHASLHTVPTFYATPFRPLPSPLSEMEGRAQGKRSSPAPRRYTSPHMNKIQTRLYLLRSMGHADSRWPRRFHRIILHVHTYSIIHRHIDLDSDIDNGSAMPR
ncbi:hypothetical protein FIBSPDRAFT_146088 [Athelia psychrophila]|uniref:Uncharacterized protein n=1 Tax=Athelia psychrophila TaxID=1759441 RepID=A0A166T4M6_9AGAM|nr:hypothetical protein FIBSPDRAFT_146088 [Fibularhizoctonia sp. CBS 109695]